MIESSGLLILQRNTRDNENMNVEEGMRSWSIEPGVRRTRKEIFLGGRSGGPCMGRMPLQRHQIAPCTTTSNRGLITKFVSHRLVSRRVPPALSSHLDYQLLDNFSIYRHSIIKLISIYIIRESNKS